MNRKMLAVGMMSIALVMGVGQIRAQSSTNFKLRSYGFGGGGGVGIGSTNYSAEGILGESSGPLTGTTYKLNAGLQYTQQANVPGTPSLVNTASWYNKLKLTINPDAADPSDAKYAIAISTDNFVTDFKYVQSDNTVSTSYGSSNFQTYTTWGGASGSFIIGLAPNTTYYVKVKTTEGAYTEGPWSPVTSAATSPLEVSFDIDIGGGSDPGETSAPYTVAFGTLTTGTVNTASNRVWVDFATNAESGGHVYVYDQYAGLRSSALSYTISSATTNLASATQGFGLQGASKTQSSGGPLNYTSPYNGAGDNVGVVNSTVSEIFNSSDAPVFGGRGSVYLKARTSAVTPASNDYADSLIMVATASF